MKNWKLVFVWIFSVGLVTTSHAQTDTAFWFAAPEVTYNNGNIHGDRPIYLRFTALAQDAVVTISQPANSSFAPIVVSVPANSSVSYDLTSRIDMIECKPSDQVLNYGLLVRSSTFITAYYEEASVNNPEIFALKGRNALGNNFFIPAQNLMTNSTAFSPAPTSSFDVVATEDNTTITITPANNVLGHAAGIPYTIVLNKGQTYSATAVTNAAAAHLMGSTVISDKPIAVTIKDDSIGGGGYAGCLDLAGDQIVPTSLIGTKYITLPGYLNNPNTQPTDQVFILAIQNNTTVTINGNVVTTLNTGQTFRQPSNNEVFYIETSQPVYVLHLSGFGCEVGHALLPQLDCSGSRTVGFTRSVSSPLYMNILVRSGGEGDFTFNGSTGIIDASLFTTVPFSSGQWKYARIQLSTAQMAAGAAAIVKNSSTDFHLSIIHGDAGTGCRYGYFSGFNRFDAVSFSNATNNNPGCSGDTLKLFCDVGATEGIQFTWTGPNGFTSTDKNPIILNAQTIHSGTYTVVATKAGCNTITATTTVLVKQSPTANASTNSPICEAQTLQLNGVAVSGAAYAWTGPNGFTNAQAFSSLTNATSAASGDYIFSVTKDGCTAKDTLAVTVKSLPSAQISSSAVPCVGQTFALSNNNTVANSAYAWSGPNGYSSNQQNISFSSFNYSDTGTYQLTVTANGCSATSSMQTTVKPNPVVQFAALNDVCADALSINLVANETTGIAGSDAWQLDGQAATNLLNIPQLDTGLHTIRYTFTANNGCSSFKEQTIYIHPLPLVDAGDDETIFLGNNVPLLASITGQIASIKWTPNLYLNFDDVANPISLPQKDIAYRLDVATIFGCTAFDSVRIKVVSNVKVPNSFSPNGDGVNDTWSIEGLEAFPRASVQVFDRGGRKVFSTQGATNVYWNGQLNGKPLPAGTYYYVIQLNDAYLPKPIAGWLMIVR